MGSCNVPILSYCCYLPSDWHSRLSSTQEMKIKFPIKIVITSNNEVWRTYNSAEEYRKGGAVRTPYRIEDANGKQVFHEQLTK